MDICEFQKLPLMGILRGIASDSIEPLTEAVISAGLKTIEITMNTAGAPHLIRQMGAVARGRLAIGAGTVLNLDQLRLALDAGATFIVMPTLVGDVTAYCVQHRIPCFPGALTPQEICNAWQAGAAMVKVFPAKMFGPAYFKEVRGPFQNIKLLACGGVTADTVGEYFACGAAGASFGGSIFDPGAIQLRDFDSIAQSIQDLIAAFGRAAA